MELISVFLPSTTPFSPTLEFVLCWHGYEALQFPFTAYRISDRYKRSLGNTMESVWRNIGKDFPSYREIEQSVYGDRLVQIEPINLPQAKLDADTLNLILEGHIFFDPFVYPDYAHSQFYELDYTIVFRFGRNSSDSPKETDLIPSFVKTTIGNIPIFNPETDDAVLVSNHLIETMPELD